MNKDNIIKYVKRYLVDAVLLTTLSSVLYKDCTAQDLIVNEVMPQIDSANVKLMHIMSELGPIDDRILEVSNIVNKVTIDIGAIKDKYVHPEKEGVNCEVRQSKYMLENEIGVFSDNEYKLVSGDRILIMNMKSSCKPSMTLTVTTDIKDDENASSNQFYLNKKNLLQLGIDTQKNKRGIYNLRFFNIE